jgi:putative ABC transport system permease protein
LASLGIFGVVAYSVEQRRQELGLRGALGAQQAQLVALVLRQGMTPVLAGMLAGAAAAFAGGNLIESLLFDVRAFDPLTFGGVLALVGVVALLACYVPARRTIRVDPVLALRYE